MRLHSYILLNLTLLLMSQGLFGQQFGIVLKAEANLLGSHTIAGGGSTETRTGLSLAGECQVSQSPAWHYGLGMAYQLPREQLIAEQSGKTFSFIPVYLLSEVYLFPSLAVNPGLILHGGYNFFSGNGYYRVNSELSGGFYGALGLSISLHEQVGLELLYKWHQGKFTGPDPAHIEYRYLAFAIRVLL